MRARRFATSLGWFTSERTALGAAVLALAMVACLMPAQSDTYWHLRAGQDIARTHAVSLVDRYSVTAAGRFWPDHEWLWQLGSYALFWAGGMPLLTAACAAAVVAAFLIAYALTVGPSWQRLGLFVAAIFLSGPGAGLRPDVITLLALMATLALVARGREWALPPLFLLWANAHGAVVLGGVVLAAGAIAAALSRDGRRLGRLAAAGAASAAATLITPLGPRLYRFIGESMARSRADAITEWRSALEGTPRSLAFWVVAAALVVLAARRWRRLPGFADRLVVLAALLFIPVAGRAVRNISAFALLALPAASRLLAAGAGASAPPAGTLAARVRRFIEGAEPASPEAQRQAAVRNARNLGLMAAAGIAFVAYAWSGPRPDLDWDPVSPSAAAAIRSCPGQVYNQYGEGGYLIWFVPEKPVFLDGRQDPYPLAFLERANQIKSDPAVRAAMFAEHGVRCAALSRRSALVSILRDDGWTQTFADGRWVVLAR
jgi:hypothetical protein